MGEIMNSACNDCDDTTPDDPLSIFPTFGQPPSLASHWIPNTQVNDKKSIGTLETFRTHYVRIPNPGDRFISMDECLEIMKRVFGY